MTDKPQRTSVTKQGRPDDSKSAGINATTKEGTAMNLEVYLSLIYRGQCPVCGKEWDSITAQHAGVMVAKPCNHRLSLSMPETLRRKKTPLGDMGVETQSK